MAKVNSIAPSRASTSTARLSTNDIVDEALLAVRQARAIVELVRYRVEARQFVEEILVRYPFRGRDSREEPLPLPGEIDDDAVALALYAAHGEILTVERSLVKVAD